MWLRIQRWTGVHQRVLFKTSSRRYSPSPSSSSPPSPSPTSSASSLANSETSVKEEILEATEDDVISPCLTSSSSAHLCPSLSPPPPSSSPVHESTLESLRLVLQSALTLRKKSPQPSAASHRFISLSSPFVGSDLISRDLVMQAQAQLYLHHNQQSLFVNLSNSDLFDRSTTATTATTATTTPSTPSTTSTTLTSTTFTSSDPPFTSSSESNDGLLVSNPPTSSSLSPPPPPPPPPPPSHYSVGRKRHASLSSSNNSPGSGAFITLEVKHRPDTHRHKKSKSSDIPLTPYPWNMPYYSSSTERPQSILRLDSNSSSLSPELRLISIAFSNYFGHLSSILSTRKERSEISTSSLVIYYHDFTTLLRAYPSRQKEIISLLAQALHNHHDVLIERHGAVIVIPSTPTYSSLHVETPGGVDGGPESGIHDHGSGRISSLLKNLFSPPSSSSSSPPSAPEEDGGSEEDHKNNNIDNQEFDFASILDSFIGIPSIKLLPPIAYTSSSSSSSSQSRQLSTHSATARTTTHSPSLLDEFKKAIEHDGKMQILATNLVEVRFAAARAGVSIKENGKEETCSSSLVSTGWDWLVQPKDLARSNDSLIFPSSSSTMTSYPHPTTTLPTSIQSRFSITLLKRIQEVGLRSAVLSDHFLTPSEADMIIRMAMGGGQSLFNASIDKDAAALVKNNEIAGSSVRVLMADSFSKVSYKDPSPVLPSPLLPPSLSSRKNSPENVTNTSPAITTTNSTAIKSKSSKPESSPITASSMNNSSTTFIQLQDLVKALETFAAVSDAENIAAAGIEYASVFKSNPRDILSLNQYEQRLLKQCLVRPSSTKSAITTTKTNNTTSSYESSFDKIGGLAKTKSLINELIRLPLHAPQLFSHGILSQSTTGILLFGPPGTGKTLLARAVATDANANFLNVQMSHVMSMWVGENEKNIQALFTLARKLRPCVLFVDEIDALLRMRGRGSPSWQTNTVNEFMQEWDGIQSANNGVVVVGATNRPFDLDEAVLRRLPRRILVDLPDVHERKQILTVLLKDETIEFSGGTSSIDNNIVSATREELIQQIAEKTQRFSGSDLKNLCIAAAMNAVRQQILPNLGSSSSSPPSSTSIPSDSNVSLSPTVRILREEHFISSLESGDVVPSLSDGAELLKDLKDWNKKYGTGVGGYGRLSGDNQWGFV